MKRVVILGATGSIGKQTIDIIEQFDSDFKLVGVTANNSVDEILKIIENHPIEAVLIDKAHHEKITDIPCYNTLQFDAFLDTFDDVVVVNALVGSVGLEPTLKVLEKGFDCLLANKETLVVGGELIKQVLPQSKGKLIPVDSEHSGLSQCLKNVDMNDVSRIEITASGGSFRDLDRNDLKDVTVKDALNHPNWSMGSKITIDSATMMNKVFEVIEAHYLFDLPYDKIEALLHKESVVHGIVHFKDGNTLMHAGVSDMRIPILTALEGEKRLPFYTVFDLRKFHTLHFETLSHERYPLFDLGIAVAKTKKSHIVVMNAANEAAVSLFLDGVIPFLEIEMIIKKALDNYENLPIRSVKQVVELDQAVKKYIHTNVLDGD